jgi:hypothetical protein
LRILKEIAQSVMRAEVAAFAGCLIPSQFARSQATKQNAVIDILLQSLKRSTLPNKTVNER